MDIKFNHTLDLTLTESQKDVLIIQLLQEICKDAYEDKLGWTNNPESCHPDDLKLAKKRYKATKSLLWYYMARDDYEHFIRSVKEDGAYVFNPDDYLDE
jgi:hypothetical protein